jgi:hypothetical protein
MICLRLDDLAEMERVMEAFSDAYKGSYFEFWRRDDHKNKGVHPITFTATVSNIKFPFFEAWRYLNSQKTKWMSVLAIRSFEMSVNPSEYVELSKINFRQAKIGRFLHKLSEVQGRTHSDLLLNTEIFNNRYQQNEIFQGVMRGTYTIHNLLCFFKMVRSSK